jgi:hypothetical protein
MRGGSYFFLMARGIGMAKNAAREIPKPPGAPTREDHKQQRRREKSARERGCAPRARPRRTLAPARCPCKAPDTPSCAKQLTCRRCCCCPAALSHCLVLGGCERRYLSYGALVSLALVALFAYIAAPQAREGICGDGLCGHDETGAQCPEDCKGSCGDGFCSMSEACRGFAPLMPGAEECYLDCGECDATATLAAAECSATASGLTAAHNASLLWGTYRPHLFNGIRTRSTKPVMVGLMWHSPAALDPLRYETTSNGVKSYGWERHDGRSFGLHNVKDTDLGVEINSSFVKDWPSFESEAAEAPKGGGDWALNVKVSAVCCVSRIACGVWCVACGVWRVACGLLLGAWCSR